MPVMGIMRNIPISDMDTIVSLYQETGFTTLEITLNSAGAVEMITKLASQYPKLNIGAGTVVTLSDLKEALKAGASFIVTPILDEVLIRYCAKRGIAVFPGALSPTEIYKAWKVGASAVKVFPAVQFGPGYLRELEGPLGNLKLLPTGGVSSENIEEFFKAGAFGVGMGSSFFDRKLIKEKEFDKLYSHFRSLSGQLKQIINTISRK